MNDELTTSELGRCLGVSQPTVVKYTETDLSYFYRRAQSKGYKLNGKIYFNSKKTATKIRWTLKQEV